MTIDGKLPAEQITTITGDPEAHVTPDGGVAAESDPNDPGSWLDRLRDLDHRDALAAAATVGGAAVALAGFYAARKMRGSLRTPEGDRLVIEAEPDRHLLRGVVSIVQIAGKSGTEGIAASFPMGGAMVDRLRGKDNANDRALFVMDPKEDHIAYPLRGETSHVTAYSQATKKAAGWLIHGLAALTGGKGEKES